jgi:hypothetical protein
MSENRFEVLLYRPTTWEVIGRFDGFEEHEVVLTMRAVNLKGSVFLALGTSNYEGEEVSARGRVILLELYFAQGRSQSGQVSQILKVKRSIAKKFPGFPCGPVVAVDAVDNLLLLVVGSRMMLYEWAEGQLLGRAFFRL